MESCTFSGSAAAGVTAPRHTVRRPRSRTASCAGRRRGVWEKQFRELAGSGLSKETQMKDSTLLTARTESEARRFTHSQMLNRA